MKFENLDRNMTIIRGKMTKYDQMTMVVRKPHTQKKTMAGRPGLPGVAAM